MRLTKEEHGGIYIPETSQELRSMGVVLKLGPEARDVRLGETVIYQFGSATVTPKDDRVSYELMTDACVISGVE